NRILWAARVWGSRSCIKLCRLTAAASAVSPKKTRGRNLRWICRASPDAPAPEGNSQMAHILVVDDERSICELLEITFRKEGHRVEVALNGEPARRKLQSQIFDIVISAIRMPDAMRIELLPFCK